MLAIGSRRLLAVSGPAIALGAVVLCAWFTSRAVDAWGATAEPAKPPLAPSEVLSDPERAQRVEGESKGRVEGRTPAAPRSVATPRDGAALVTRNMFCSTCVMKEDDGGSPQPGGAGGAHTLPRVIATHVGDRGGGWATLEVAGLSGGFVQGATLPGGGVIESIERGAIVVRFADGTERVPLATDGAGDGASGAGASRDTTGADKVGKVTEPAKADPWADRVRAVGDNRWEVDRTLIKELVAAGTSGNPAAKGVRLMPVNKDGKLAGVRVAAARTGSLASTLGLATGDVIESIDGQTIDSPQTLMKMYDRLGDLRRVDLGVKRKGENVTLTYDLP